MSNSSNVELKLKTGKKVKVNCKINFNVLIRYEALKKEEISDYRLFMCKIIYALISHEDREKISINDIIQVDNDSLKIIGEQILNNTELKEYFEEDRDFFESFKISFDLYFDKVRKEMISTLKPAFEPILELVNSENIFGKKVEEINTALVSGIKELIKPMETVRKGVNNFLLIFRDVFQSFYEFGNIANKFVIIILELDYPPMDLYYEEMKEVVDCYEEFGIEKVKSNLESIIITHYDNEVLKHMLIEWGKKEWGGKRIKILEDIIQAYLERKYNLVVPTLLAQIEGTIAEGFNHEGRMTGKILNSYVEELLSNKEGNLSGAIDSMAKKFISQVVLVQFIHGQDIPSSLSRHAILHGADTEYGTQINALKAILLFDYIQETIERENSED